MSDPRIITQNFDQLFTEIQKTAQRQGIPITKVSEVLGGPQQIKKLAQGLNANVSTTRMAPNLWAPDLQISSMVLPQTIIEKNRFRRFYYAHDPLVGTAIDIHTRYPLSGFRLTVEDDTEGSISDAYEEVAEQIDLFKLFHDIGQEWWVVGEAFPFGNWNEHEESWDSFVLINPDYVDVQTNPFSDRDVFISIVRWNKLLKQVVSNGPNHAKTGKIYRHMMETARDVINCIANGQPYHLSPAAVSHLSRKVSYHDTRGTAIIDRIFKWLMYQDKLQAAQLALADRHITPIEVWTVGETGNEADTESLADLENVIRNTWNSPLKCIIWNHTLKGEIIGASGSAMPLGPEYDYINQQKMIGLMINDAIMTAQGPTYASASVAADVMASWYASYRQELERWAIRHVFMPVANARGYYAPNKKEILGQYRDRTVKRKPLLPKIVWDKASLRDDYQKLQTMINLAQQGRVPWQDVYEMLNLNFDDVVKKIEKESKIFGQLALGANPFAGGVASEGMLGGAGGDMGMGGDIMPLEPGGEGMPAGPDVGDMNAMPSSGEGSPGGLIWPNESAGMPSGGEMVGM